VYSTALLGVKGNYQYFILPHNVTDWTENLYVMYIAPALRLTADMCEVLDSSKSVAYFAGTHKV